MTTSKSIYMFHAIGSRVSLQGCDLHYSYSKERFLEFITDCESVTSLQKALNGAAEASVITFDDGHLSNFDAAITIKDVVDGSADFFVNPNMVGKKHFMDWQQIRELHDMGMSIQSHSLDHVYLSDLSYDQQKIQLLHSKEFIEDKIGSEVVILAPPGGRYNQDTIEICQDIGYQHISVSSPGKWSQGYLSNRISVLHNTAVDDLIGCQKKRSWYLTKQVFKYHVTGTAKKVLGNDRYDEIRSRLLSAQI
ncbi:MAG: polysaccharide deacetylase family protein [Colwellia sp.]